MTEKVSVIIPTYNRFSYLLNAINSIKKQTYNNTEIIVVNDCSTQEEYYKYKFEDCIVIHLEKNSRVKFGFPCVGYTRSLGIKIASGEYISFLDDDDYWLPKKLVLQLNAMKSQKKCKMSCTEGFIGEGVYNPNKKYPLYLREHYWEILSKKLNLKDDFPDVWNYKFLRKHNSAITSSVVMHKDICDKIGLMKNVRIGIEDRDYWLRAVKHTNIGYVKESCIYYDIGHGNGQNHQY